MHTARVYLPDVYLDHEEKTFTSVIGSDQLTEKIANPEILTAEFISEYEETLDKLAMLLRKIELVEMTDDDDVFPY